MNELKPGQVVFYDDNPPVVIKQGEMSLRDYFAAKALQGICSRPLMDLANEASSIEKDVKTYVTDAAYSIADVMLKARKKND